MEIDCYKLQLKWNCHEIQFNHQSDNSAVPYWQLSMEGFKSKLNELDKFIKATGTLTLYTYGQKNPPNTVRQGTFACDRGGEAGKIGRGGGANRWIKVEKINLR